MSKYRSSLKVSEQHSKPRVQKSRNSFVGLAVFSTFVVLLAHFVYKNPWIFREIADLIEYDEIEYASNKNYRKVFEELSDVLGSRCFRDDKILREHSKDRSNADEGYPNIVVYPKTAEEVQEVMRICDKYDMIVVPQGYNSGVEGASTPIHGGVAISTKLMTKILELNEMDLQLTVQTGIGIREINEYLEPLGYTFNCLPNSYPSIGGAISTHASGLEVSVYGTIKDNVVSLEVVLSDGRKIRTRALSEKSSAGYDLTSLIIGSEGTLGFVTQATLKIYKLHTVQYAGIAVFENLEDVAHSAVDIKKLEMNVNRMEILNGDAMNAVNKYFGVDYPLVSHMFLDIRGDDEDHVISVTKKVEEVISNNNGKSVRFTSDKEERDEIWHSRNKVFFALVKNRENCTGCRLFHTDLCVPMSKFVEIIVETEKEFTEYFGHSPIVSHASDGNFHVGLPIDYENEEEVEKAEEFGRNAAIRAIKLGGTGSGEHGIGLMKKHLLPLEFGEDGVDVMRSIKKSLDPKNMMNPGKVFDL